MKPFIHFLIIFTFLSFQAQATTYYSTQDGNWTNPIWSTVSHGDLTGLTALPCQFTGNDSVYIAHSVTSNCGLLEIGQLGGSSVIQITPTGTFISNGLLDIFGGFIIAIIPGTSVIVNGDLNMHGTSEIIVDGTLTINGDVEMWGNTSVCGTGTATYTGTLTEHGNGPHWMDCAGLPIELSSFNVHATEQGVEVIWATSSELNNDFFSVERSLDGKNYEVIAQVEGAGTSVQLLEYSYLDKSNLQDYAWVYYRIKQTDFDGSFEYTNIVAVAPYITNNITDIQVYPNPANTQFNIQLNKVGQNSQVRVFNIMGQLISQQTIQDTYTNFNVEDWEAGSYILVINIDKQQLQQRIIIE